MSIAQVQTSTVIVSWASLIDIPATVSYHILFSLFRLFLNVLGSFLCADERGMVSASEEYLASAQVHYFPEIQRTYLAQTGQLAQSSGHTCDALPNPIF